MIVCACAQKRDNIPSGCARRVLAREFSEVIERFRFGQGSGQVKRPVESQVRGNSLKEFVNRSAAHFAQHPRHAAGPS
jgi:hypothetical protein